MASAFSQLRSFITDKLPAPRLVYAVKSTPAPANQKTGDDSLEPHPCVGFRASFNAATRVLTVTVMAARHLPASVHNVPAVGYIVKVKLYPGKDKYETTSRPESWPTYNESFDFKLAPPAAGGRTSSDVSAHLTSNKFVTFTVLGVDKAGRSKPLGSATWPLDHAAFTPSKRGDAVETGDVWRRVQDLSTGLARMSADIQQRRTQRVKDQLELSLCHVTGDVGEDDVIRLRLFRLRWSLEKTREYQHKEADMYVKLSVINSFGQVLRCIKTLCFAPSISITWPVDDKRAILEVSVPPLGPRNRGCRCVATLCAKLGRGKKVHLGRLVISQVPEQPECEAAHWTHAMRTPGTASTEWHDLLPVEE